MTDKPYDALDNLSYDDRKRWIAFTHEFRQLERLGHPTIEQTSALADKHEINASAAIALLRDALAPV